MREQSIQNILVESGPENARE